MTGLPWDLPPEAMRMLATPFVSNMFAEPSSSRSDDGDDDDDDGSGEFFGNQQSGSGRSSPTPAEGVFQRGKKGKAKRRRQRVGSDASGDGSDDGGNDTRIEDRLYAMAHNLEACAVLAVPEYWEDFTCGHVDGSGFVPGGFEADVDPLWEGLETLGFLTHEPAFVSPKLLKKMRGILVDLGLLGWPPPFAFLFDEFWSFLDAVWPTMGTMLGGECVLEPSFFAYALSKDPQVVVGQNFGLPHRDYSYDEPCHPDGRPKLLNLWLPLTDATADNGCLTVVPREFDAFFSKAGHYSHMRCAVASDDELGTRGCGGDNRVGATLVRFPVQGARQLIVPAGSLCAWLGNLIHWGGACSQHTKDRPRMSMTCTFRAPGSAATRLEKGNIPPITRAEVHAPGGLSLDRRLQLVANSLLLYNYWYDLPAESVPAFFLREDGDPVPTLVVE